MFRASKILQAICPDKINRGGQTGSECGSGSQSHIARRSHEQICKDIMDFESIRSVHKKSCPCADRGGSNCFESLTFGDIANAREKRASLSPDQEGIERRQLLKDQAVIGDDGRPQVPLEKHLVCLHAYIDICGLNPSTGKFAF
jgi:hypothetical protein